ncbi:hypothetical protein D3C71_1386020 [compost metagenome]
MQMAGAGSQTQQIERSAKHAAANRLSMNEGIFDRQQVDILFKFPRPVLPSKLHYPRPSSRRDDQHAAGNTESVCLEAGIQHLQRFRLDAEPFRHLPDPHPLSGGITPPLDGRKEQHLARHQIGPVSRPGIALNYMTWRYSESGGDPGHRIPLAHHIFKHFTPPLRYTGVVPLLYAVALVLHDGRRTAGLSPPGRSRMNIRISSLHITRLE